MGGGVVGEEAGVDEDGRHADRESGLADQNKRSYTVAMDEPPRFPPTPEGDSAADVRAHLPLRPLADGGIVTRGGVVLSAREARVLHAIWLGWPRRRTAAALGVSVETVTRDRRRLTAKLGLRPERLAVLCDRAVATAAPVAGGRAPTR